MKKTISEKINHKKYTKPNKLVHSLYHFLFKLTLAPKYNIKIDRIDDSRKCEGPCFIIYNHLSRIDHGYVLMSTYPRRYNMVAGYNEFYRKKFKFVFGIENVIPKRNYMPDLMTLRAINKAIKSGSDIAFAPEGLASNDGTNKPIVPGTSSMFKHYKLPVYMIINHGNFLQNTKWCLDERYGITNPVMSLLFTAEQTQELSVEEMDDIINEKFRSDEFKWTKERHIYWKDKHNRLAHNMEYVCYKCPKCGKEFTMESKGNEIYCTSCGNGTKINNYYEFEPYEGSVVPESPLAWSTNQRVDIIKEIRKDPNYHFEDECEIGCLDPNKYIKNSWDSSFKVGSGKIWIDHNGFHYDGTKNNQPHKFDVSWKELYTSITIMDASYFTFYVKGEYYDFFPKHKTAFKFIYLIEEMHRYHVNWYKNFKWNDWMYEGLELGIDNKK